MAWTNLSFAYGSVLTSTKMTQMYDNMTTISPLFASGLYGTLIAFSGIPTTNLTWSPNASTKKIVVLVVGGGSGGAGSSGANHTGEGGHAGAQTWGVSTSVSGTYAATIGAGSAGGAAGTDSTTGAASSFIGTGISVTAAGGIAARYRFQDTSSDDYPGHGGESCIGVGGLGVLNANGAAAAANSGAGGGGGSTSASRAGGAGGSGAIFIWEYS